MIELTKMSLSETERYREYKYKKQVKTGVKGLIEILLLGILCCTVTFYTAFQSENWKIIIYYTILFVGILLAFLYGMYKKVSDIKKATGSSYEYAIVKVKFGEEFKIQCSNGEELSYEFKSNMDGKFKNGEEAAVVYIPLKKDVVLINLKDNS